MANSTIIRVTPEELKSSAARVEEMAGQVKNETQQMIEIVTSLTGRIWSGEAETQYVSKFNGLNDDIARLIELVKKNSQHLYTISNEYQTAENTNKDTAATLVSDVIV